MKVRVAITTGVLAVASFAAGFLWPAQLEVQALMGQAMALATPVHLALFVLLAAVQSTVFGLGVSFLLYGYPTVASLGAVSPGLARAAHLAIAWSLINWWPHGNLHQKLFPSPGVTLAIEYGFHGTIWIAAGVVAWFFLRVVRERRTVPL
jgi:hypothetical protein